MSIEVGERTNPSQRGPETGRNAAVISPKLIIWSPFPFELGLCPLPTCHLANVSPRGSAAHEPILVHTAFTDTCNPFTLKTTLILFSALSFLGYGLGCFFSDYLKGEFRRYQLSAQCQLVGALQCAAALGLLAGFEIPWLGQAAAGGLALMMLVALGVRIKIRDSVGQMLPALGYLALNAYLCVAGF